MAKNKEIANERVGRFKSQDAVKLRGGYYTSPKVADWLCTWAIRGIEDRVLEPSCGDGVFLVAALERFLALGANSAAAVSPRLMGVEIISEEADLARQNMVQRFGQGVREVVQTSDFFEAWQQFGNQTFDAVVGNPPFIRYQNFPEQFRNLAMDIMRQQGLKPNRLTNIWVPFVVAATASLTPGGRLALVLPAELLQVSYAAQLRSYLVDHFSRIDIVACNELFFDNAEQEVLLLLAEGALSIPSGENNCRVTMTQATAVDQIVKRPSEVVLASTPPKTVRHDSEKWLKYFLDNNEIALMRKLRDSAETTNLSTYASVDVGIVTGRNSFFVLGSQRIAEVDLEEYSVPIISRSEQLRGACLTAEEWQGLADQGNRVHLLHLSPINGHTQNEALQKYIQLGEEQGIHQGYKCSNRSPWYAVPSVWRPEGFLFRQIYDFPRLVLNNADATSTDTIHRLRFNYQPELVISNSYTYLTSASAEIEGRSYGGGVLELEPTEAERLLMPGELCQGLPVNECDRMIRSRSLEDLLRENSRLILVDGLGMSESECQTLRDIWLKLRNRRNARRRRRTRAVGLGT